MNKYLLSALTRISYSLFKRYPIHAKEGDIRSRPFFILGSGRNGSTLLSLILNQHSQIFIPREQYALHYAAIRFQLYNFLIWQLVKIIIGEFASSQNSQGWNTNFNDLYPSLNQIPKSSRSFQKIIDEIVFLHAKQKGVKYRIWGDKSLLTPTFLKFIHKVYPDSRYIFLIKDGRDVVSSFHNAGEKYFGSLANIKHASEHWKLSIDRWKWLKKKTDPLQCHEIRFEDLVYDPEKTIKEALFFLGFKFEPEIFNYKKEVEKRGFLDQPHHKSLSEPISSANVGKWKENLSTQQISEILPIIRSELQEYGYLL